MSTKHATAYHIECDLCKTSAPQGESVPQARENAKEAGFLVLHNLDLCAPCFETIVKRELADLRQEGGATQ